MSYEDIKKQLDSIAWNTKASTKSTTRAGTSGNTTGYDKVRVQLDMIAEENEPTKVLPGFVPMTETTYKAKRDTMLRYYKKASYDALMYQQAVAAGGLGDPAAADAAERARRLKEEIERLDIQSGKGPRDLDLADRAATIFSGGTKQSASGYLNFMGTGLDLMKESAIRLGGDISPYAGYATDEVSAGQIGRQQAQKEDFSDVQQFVDKLQSYADSLGESASQDFARAKNGLGKLGQAGVDIAANVLQMGYDAALGGLGSMFARSAGSAAQEARQQGADVFRQAAYGAASGGVEVLTEKMFDGVAKIYGAGAADEAVEEAIRKLTKSDFGRTALRWFAGAAGEGIEEVVSDLVAPYAETLYNGKSVADVAKGTFTGDTYNLSEILYDFIIGAAIGGLGGATSVTTGQNAQANRELLERDAGLGDVTSQANDAWEVLTGRRTAAQQAERERAARERLGITEADVAARNAETQAENLTAELTEEQKKQNRTETMRGILSRSSEAAGVQMTDEEATAIAEGYEAGTNGRLYAAAATDAYKLGKSGQYTLEEAMKASHYTARLSAEQFRNAFEAGAGAAETNAVDTSTEEGRQTLTAALSSLGEHAEDAASAYEAGQDVSRFAAGMSEAAERYAVTGADIRAQDGGVPAESVISTLTDAQIEKAQEIGGRLRETRAAAVSQLAEQRKAIRAQAQAIEQQGAADTAALTEVNRQIREANKLGRETVEMFEAQRDALTKAVEADPNFQNTEEYAKAFDEAKANMEKAQDLQRAVEDLNAKKKALEGKAPAKRKKGTVSLDGGNIAGTDYAGIDRSKLTRQQQNIVAMVERLADFINIDYVVFDGPANMGGAYLSGGRVFININAGMTQAGRKSIAAASLSHELTHFMQDYAPEEYLQLKDYVIGSVLKKSSAEFDRLVEQQRRWEPGKSYDELVANACQSMLTDDRAVQKMARSNMTLAQRVADVLDDISERIRKAFEGLSFDENRALYAPVKAVMDEIDGITERWADGISAAVENYNAEQTVKNSVPVEEVLQDGKPKFQMTEDVEATDQLVAVHNKSVSGLRRMLQRGGVPFPSIAIKKAGASHEGFGEVSIVFPRSTIDPAASRWNRLYSNDAWTPTEPATEYEVDERATSQIRRTIEGLVGKNAYNLLSGSSYLHDGQLETDLRSSKGNIFEALKNRSVLKYAYLKSTGRDVELPTREKPLDGSYKYDNQQLLALFDTIGEDRLLNGSYEDEALLTEIADVLNRQNESRFTKEKILAALRRHPKFSANNINLSTIQYALQQYQMDGRQLVTETDSYELDRTLRNNQEIETDPAYREWIEQTFGNIVKDSGIPNGKDMYTDSGNMRSFKSRHVPATLENIVQQMRKENERGNGAFGVNLRGAATKSYSSVEEMRADSGKLLGTHVADDVFDGYMDDFNNRLHEMASAATKYPDSMGSYDTARETLLEAVRDAKSKAQMDRMLKKDAAYIKYTPALADQLWELRNDVQNMPAPYFEAKPRRIVYPEEALAYILPDNADSDVVQMLDKRGYNVLTYKAGDEQDRLDKLNSVEGARFQVWDDTTEDTAAEREGRNVAYARLQSENAILRETVDELRKLSKKHGKTIEALQKKLSITKTPETRQSDARKLAKALVQEHGSKADVDALAEKLKALGDYILQTETDKLSEDEIKNRARSIARDIVESATEQISIGDDTFQRIAGEIKGRKLSIDEDFLGELDQTGGYDAFRKSVFGNFTLAKRESASRETRDGYMTVDQFYTDMQGEYGKGLFPDAANEGEQVQILSQMLDAAKPMEVNPFEQYMGEATEDMANQIVMDAMNGVLRQTAPTTADRQKARTQALKEQIDQLKAENKLEQREAASLYHTIYDLSVALDQAESRYQTLQTEADYRVTQMRAEGRARAAEIKAAERAEANRKIKNLREYYQRQKQRAREMRTNSANAEKYRKQITKKVGVLRNMLVKNSDKEHVPEVLKAPLSDFLASIDLSSKSLLNNDVATKADEKNHAAFLKLVDIFTNQQEYINGDGEVKSDLGGYMDISADSMEFLRNTASLIYEAMNTGEEYTINRMNAEQLKSLSNFLSNLTTAIRNMNDFMANARYASVQEAADADIAEMEKLGKAPESAGSAASSFTLWENGVPYYIFKRFGAGARSLFDGFTRGWERLAFNAQEIIEFTKSAYKTSEVNKWTKERHKITLSDGSEIEMTTGQIMGLSMLLRREQALRHIEHGGIRIGDIETRRGKLHDTQHYHLTAEDIANITGLLTERQMEVAKKLQQFMAVKGAEWGNEVSMRRFGYKFYTEGEFYYPIKTDSNDRPLPPEDHENSMFRLLNLSASKSPDPRATNALVVDDIFDVFADHMSDMAKLNGMGLPILDAIKWFNYKDRVKLGDGKFNTRTVQSAMEQAFGKPALRYFRTLIKDINGVNDSGDRGTSLPTKLMSNYKIAAVGGNLRVMFLQPTSYLRAMTVLKPQHMVGVLPSKAAYREALKYSGTAVWKALGYYDTDIARSLRGQIKHDETFKDKFAEASMTGAELGDSSTWSRLWQACKRQAKAENKGISGDELMEKTADLFREVIYSSQVMDSTLTRSEIMRGRTGWTKAMSAFMAEPTLSYNILMDAASDLDLDRRKYGGKKAWQRNVKKIGKAFTIYVTSAAFSAVVESIFDAIRDDDDEEFWKKFTDAFIGEDGKFWTGNYAQDLTIVGKLPYLKDIISKVQGYKSGDISLTAFSNLIDAYKIWEETIKLSIGAQEKATKVTGFGRMTEWGKVYKTLQALSQLSGFSVSNMTRDAVAIWNTAMNGIKDEWKIRTYEQSSTELANSLIRALEGGDTDEINKRTGAFDSEKDALAAVKEQLKDDFGNGTRDRESVEKLLEKAGMDEDDIWLTIHGWETGDGSAVYNAAKRAAFTGDRSTYRAEVEGLTDHGKTESAVQKEVKDLCKDVYFGNELTEKEQEIIGDRTFSRSELRSILVNYGGMDRDTADETLDQWQKDKRFQDKYGFSWSERKDQFYSGAISRKEALRIIMDYDGVTEEEAEEKVEVWEWSRDVRGAEEITLSAVQKYNEFCEAAGVSKADYVTAWSTYNKTEPDKAENGETIRNSKMFKYFDYLGGLPLTADEKTAIALTFYSAKNVKKYKTW